MATRKPARVLPDPVGAAIRVSVPPADEGPALVLGRGGPVGEPPGEPGGDGRVEARERGAHPAQGTGRVWRGIPLP